MFNKEKIKILLLGIPTGLNQSIIEWFKEVGLSYNIPHSLEISSVIDEFFCLNL